MFQRRLVPLAACLLAAATVSAQDGAPAPYGSMRAKEVFEQFLRNFTKAKSIKVTYDAQVLGNAAETFEVLLARPNVGYLKGRSLQVYLDGKQITVYNGSKNTYYTMPETADNIRKAFMPFEISVWRLFFQPTAYAKAFEIRSNGFRVRKGLSMQVIEIQSDIESLQSTTLYTDPQDNQLRQAEFRRQEPKRKTITLLDMKEFKTDVTFNPTDFNFQIPRGATFKKP